MALLLTTCLTAAAQKLPTVAVLSTGGTIASKQDPSKGGYVPALSGEDLVSAVPAIKRVAQIQVEQITSAVFPAVGHKSPLSKLRRSACLTAAYW